MDRDLGGQLLKSIQWVQDGLLIEKAGLMRSEFCLLADETGLSFEFQRAWFLSVPLPGFLSPQIKASALAEDYGWRVDVRLSTRRGVPVLRFDRNRATAQTRNRRRFHTDGFPERRS